MKLFKVSTTKKIFLFSLLSFTALSFLPSCSNKTPDKQKEKEPAQSSQAAPVQTEKLVKTIETDEQFKQILDKSGDRLLIFDLYADWCQPCKILTPTLEELAGENKDKTDFYKINVDKHRKIASMFGVKGIPFIVFVKNGKGVHSLTGVQPKSAYQNAIDKFYAETP